MGASDIKIRFGADDSRLMQGINTMHKKILASAQKMERIGSNMMSSITLPVIALGAASIKSLADVDRLSKGLVGIMGDADRAGKEFQNLRKLSKGAGLDLKSAVEGSIKLQAIGFEASKARDTLKTLANAVALVGGSGEELSGVSLAITQIISKGKVHAEEINQMAERLPQVRKAMIDAFGSADTEVLQKMGISAEDFVDGIVAELAKLPKAQMTVTDQLNNMKDEFMLMAASIGSYVLPIFNKLMGVIANSLKVWTGLDSRTKSMVINFTAIVAAIGPAIWALGKLKLAFAALTSMSTIKALFNPWTLAIAGIAAGAYLIVQNWDVVRQFIVRAGNKLIDLYNNSMLFRAVIEGTVVFFKQMVISVKLIAKLLLNSFTTLGGVLKSVFKGEFKEIPSIIKEGAKDQLKIYEEAGEEFGEALTRGINNTLVPMKKEHINASDVDNFFKPMTDKILGMKELISSVLGGGFGGGDPDGAMVNTDRAPVQKDKVGDISKVTTKFMKLGVAADDVASRVAASMQIVKVEGAKAFDYTSASFEDLINGLSKGIINFKDLSIENWQEIGKSAADIMGNIGNIVGMFYDNKMERINQAYDREKEAIQGSRMSEEAKSRRLEQLDKKIDRERRKAARDQAKRDKAAAIFQATINGIVQVSANLGNPIMAAIVGALAAANVAAIASQPLPALAKGGIVHGRTAVEVGEYPGVSSNPEVISPLKDLKRHIKDAAGGGLQNIALMGGWKVTGNQLSTVLRGYEATRQRLTA